MDISADRAYWLLHSYSARATRLHFGGVISGEEAACDAVILEVDRELQLAVVELFEASGTRSWCRPVPLRNATFQLAMLGDPDVEQWAASPFHLVLALRYPDGTTLVFAERARMVE